MAARNVAPEDTFADFRQTYIGTCTDIGDITTLNNTFTGTTPTDLVEAINKAPGTSFAIAMCVALG